MRGFAALSACAVLALTAPAVAAELDVRVLAQGGAPVAGAVVTVRTPGTKPPARFDQPLRVSQKDLRFSPDILVAPVGAEVVFANEDRVRHHVYSFSAAKRFELKLFGSDQVRSVQFDKPGVVALGCNIHDFMSAYVLVTDAAFAVRTDASGRAVIRDLPAGPLTVEVWRPYLRAGPGGLKAELTASKDGRLQQVFTGQYRPPPPMPGM